MGFRKEEFDESLEFYKNNNFTHEELIRWIKNTKTNLETRAAACVADGNDDDDDFDWDQEAYENYNSSRFDEYTNSELEYRIASDCCYKEYRIAAANELHRRVVETDNPHLPEEYTNEADKPIPYVPTYDPEFIRESYNELISIAEGQGEYSSPFHFSGPSITQEQARNMLIEYNKRPKVDKPKHPDILKALDGYPNTYQKPRDLNEIYKPLQAGEPLSEWARNTYRPLEPTHVGGLETYYVDGKRPKLSW